MLAILGMSKPKNGEVIAFDGECAVYTDDDMQVHRYPLIEIDDELMPPCNIRGCSWYSSTD